MRHRAINFVKRLVKSAFDKEDLKRKRFDEESVQFQKLMTANNPEVFEQMYASPQLLEHYLDKERLAFYKLVASKIGRFFGDEKKGLSCLDVGCGTGHLLKELRAVGFAGRLVGVDTASAAMDSVRGQNADLEFYSGFLSEQTWAEPFDIILCTEVLEHCDYPEQLIREMKLAVRPGGTIFITVPDGRKDTWDGHIHFWSPESFKLLITSFGGVASFDYFENTNFCGIRC